MTGCGEAVTCVQNWQVEIQLRSINSKYFDSALRLPSFLEQKELDLQKILQEALARGKVSLLIRCTQHEKEKDTEELLSIEHFQKHWRALQAATATVGAQVSTDALLTAVMKHTLIKSVAQPDTSAQEILWPNIQEALQQTIQQCQRIQQKEGEQIEQQLIQEIKATHDLLTSIDELSADRAVRIQQKLRARMQEHVSADETNQRWAQELFFYLERIDFTEEKERLRQHLRFFTQALKTPEICKGKKLLFICQEIGREQNTLGAKAQDAQIQEKVVLMKSALERMKEQLQNVK